MLADVDTRCVLAFRVSIKGECRVAADDRFPRSSGSAERTAPASSMPARCGRPAVRQAAIYRCPRPKKSLMGYDGDRQRPVGRSYLD